MSQGHVQSRLRAPWRLIGVPSISAHGRPVFSWVPSVCYAPCSFENGNDLAHMFLHFMTILYHHLTLYFPQMALSAFQFSFPACIFDESVI